MRRPLLLSLVLLALCAPAAHAQSNPFGPLPVPTAPAATPEPVQDPREEGAISRSLLFGIAGAVLLVFIGIGLYISRDARKHLSTDDRRTLEREKERVDEQRVRGERVKKKARDKTRAQKQARKKQRSRR